MKKLEKIIYYLFIFCISSVIGWLLEEIYVLLFKNKIVNRGFLYVPYLPLYGFGAVLIILLLKKYKNNIYIVLPFSIIITEILEYFTGYFLYLIYHKKWWYYKGALLNINGFICLKSAIIFSFSSLILIYIIEPLLKKIYDNNYKTIRIITIVLSLIILFDFIFTIINRYRVVLWIN